MAEHKYAHFLRAIADGKDIEVKDICERWVGCSVQTALKFIKDDIQVELRVKPETITINGHEVPEPYRGEMVNGQTYFCPTIWNELYFTESFWSNAKSERIAQNKGMIHLTKEAAIAHGKALASFTEVKK